MAQKGKFFGALLAAGAAFFFIYHGILLGRSKNGVFRFFFLIRDLWAVWCPQTGKTKIKLKFEVFGEILGNFSTPPVHLLKIRIRATFDPPGVLKKHFCKKVENLTLTPNTDFQ